MKNSEKLSELNKCLENLLNMLNSLDEENFDQKIKEINSEVLYIKMLKKELNLEFSDEILYSYSQYFGNTAKLVKSTFDNKVKEIKEKQLFISEELKKLNNQKKLSIYR